jgi:hypothetical protein
MASKDRRLRVGALLLILGLVTSVSAFAGSAVIGSVAGSMNATMSGQAVSPGATIFSGQKVAVSDGAMVVMTDGGSRLVFGRGTEASFSKDSDEITVGLNKGTVYISIPAESPGLKVKIGDLSIVPAKGFKTLGEVAMLNGSLRVTAKEGSLRVEGAGSPVEVAQGKTLTLVPRAARAPRAAGPNLGSVSSSTALAAGSVAAGGLAAVFSVVAMTRAGDARDNAAAATTAALAAGKSAAAAATYAANANTNAIRAGCALNIFAKASPFSPAAGTGTGPGC